MANHITNSPPVGQEPLNFISIVWTLSLVVLWSINSVIVKFVVRDIPPFFSAFFRFLPATLLIIAFVKFRKISLKVTLKEFGFISIIGILAAAQIFTFVTGAQFTTGGRVSLFMYSYPFFVALLAPVILKDERFHIQVIAGCIIALTGLVIALYSRLEGGGLKGDLIELLSAFILCFRVVVNKRVMLFINKWKVLVWNLLIASFLYGAGGLVFEKVNFSAIQWDAWAALVFQIIFTTCFTFVSWQYLLSKHNAAKLNAFFFASPVFGMIWGIILLKESFDPGLIAGCVFVGAGILLVQKR